MSDNRHKLFELSAESLEKLQAAGRDREADELAQSTLKMALTLPAIPNPQTARSLLALAKYFLSAARGADAGELIERVTAYYRQQAREVELGEALYLQALSVMMAGDKKAAGSREAARGLLVEAAKIFHEHPGKQPLLHSAALKQLALLANGEGDLPAALSLLDEAIFLLRVTQPADHPELRGLQRLYRTLTGEQEIDPPKAPAQIEPEAPPAPGAPVEPVTALDDLIDEDFYKKTETEDAEAGYAGEQPDGSLYEGEYSSTNWEDVAGAGGPGYGDAGVEDETPVYRGPVQPSYGDQPGWAGDGATGASPPPAAPDPGERRGFSTRSGGEISDRDAAAPPPTLSPPGLGRIIGDVIGSVGGMIGAATSRFGRGQEGAAHEPPPEEAAFEEAPVELAGESSEASDESPAPPPLLRYPTIDCPSRSPVGERFSLFVQLLTGAPSPIATVLAIADTRDPLKPPEVELVLRAPGFELVDGVNTRMLPINRSGDSEERFVLIPRELGEQTIRVDFYQHGRRLGTERRQVTVYQPVSRSQPEAPPPPALADEEPVVLKLSAKPTIPPPDLEIVVLLDRDEHTLRFELHTTREAVGYHRFDAGECSLAGPPVERLQALFTEVSRLAHGMAGDSRHFTSGEAEPDPALSAAEAERRLARLGNQLWDELVPDKLKAEYWNFKDQVQTVLITSDEPWAPWEMIKPYRFDEQGNPQDEPYWCQQFALARWLSGQGPADLLSIDSARSIAPQQSDLPAIAAEIAFLAGLPSLRPRLRLLDPLFDLQGVLQWLENGQASILHFACHGIFDSSQPMNSAILLTGGALRPSDLRVRFGGMRPRPLVFINACHGGRVDFSFTGLGGWATRMVAARVGAFVGAMWEVDDELALTFARSFYTALLKDNQPLAMAFRSAREEVRKAAPHNSTWLAYVLYADPECRVLGE